MNAARYLDGSYLEQAPNWHVEDSPWKAGQVSRILARNRVEVQSVTDIGCGAGVVLAELQRMLPGQPTLTGFDISPQAIALTEGMENPQLHFHAGDFFKTSTAVQDVLLVLDVLEHVDDYLGFLEKIKGRTAWAVFHIPIDISAFGVLRGSAPMLYMRRHFGHLHYFTKETAIATLTDAGFEVVDRQYTDDLAIPGVEPRTLTRRIYHMVRKAVFTVTPGFAVSLFNSYSMLVLARVQPAPAPAAAARTALFPAPMRVP